MFDHVTVRASSYDESLAFYGAVLGAMEIEPTRTSDRFAEWDDFSILPVESGRTPTRHLHVGFAAAARAEVDRFWQAGIDAGYQDDGPPGERDYTPGYYGAFLWTPTATAPRPSTIRTCAGEVTWTTCG